MFDCLSSSTFDLGNDGDLGLSAFDSEEEIDGLPKAEVGKVPPVASKIVQD